MRALRTLPALAFLVACNGGGRDGRVAALAAASAASPERVALTAEPLPAPDGARRAWRFRFGPGGRGAFDLLVRVPPPAHPDSAAPIERGVLRRVAGADGRAFTAALRGAFGADTVLGAVARADSLPVDVGVLGRRLARGPGRSLYAGEFTADRPGDWLVAKLFLAGGGAEVFLALNTRSGEAQLIAKDPEYANGVLAEFARLF